MQHIEWRINSIFNSAKLSKLDANYIREEYTKLASELNSRTPSGKLRYSKFLSAYAFGYRMALNNQLWQNELEFCYVVDGVIYSTHKDSIHNCADKFYSLGSEFMDRVERGHYWKNSYCKFA